jgi:nucleoside-diphosphate-sugar epimerase
MERVAVTGGNGTLGRAVLEQLHEEGYETVNVNRGRRDEAIADHYVRADLTDPGEVYGALARADADAVAHLGMVPTPESTPEYVTFESNALSPFLVLRAAAALGVESVCLASSLSAIGGGYEPDPVAVDYLPVDEAHPLSPTTPYGLGKQVLEVVGDGFGRRNAPETVTSLRFPWVTDEQDMRETFVEPDRELDDIRASGDFHTARNTLFAYVALPDAVRAVRQALTATHSGHERVWVVADDTTTETPSAEVVETVYGDADVRAELAGCRSLVSTEKARELLEWEPRMSWRELSR